MHNPMHLLSHRTWPACVPGCRICVFLRYRDLCKMAADLWHSRLIGSGASTMDVYTVQYRSIAVSRDSPCFRLNFAGNKSEEHDGKNQQREGTTIGKLRHPGKSLYTARAISGQGIVRKERTTETLKRGKHDRNVYVGQNKINRCTRRYSVRL